MLETCFVITPFGGQFDDTYKKVIIPAVEAGGYKPIRGDDVYSTREVIADIFHEIRSASVLVADVSGKNANVNYELGIAHAFNKPVVIIAQQIEDIPFDYRHLRFIIYDTRSEGWATDLSDRITNTLQAQKKESQQVSAKDGLKTALGGKWVGLLDQQVEGGSVSIETELEMALAPDGRVQGTWTLLAVSQVGYTIVFKVSCTTLYERYIKLDFFSADETVMTFGTIMARLSANARMIEGQYVGYGSISDRIVTGAIVLRKAQA